MKLSEIRINHSSVAARCYATNYYAASSCKVIPSVVKKGMYKFVLVHFGRGSYPHIGSINQGYAHPVYRVNALYNAKTIKKLYKMQLSANKQYS